MIQMRHCTFRGGARMDIFQAAMLGRLEIVKPMLLAYPSLAASKGRHGITLMEHAEAGGDGALAVVLLLEVARAASSLTNKNPVLVRWVSSSPRCLKSYHQLAVSSFCFAVVPGR
jgi:hypothetical protein